MLSLLIGLLLETSLELRVRVARALAAEAEAPLSLVLLDAFDERPKSSAPKAANSAPTLAEAASFAARRGKPLVVFTGGFESAGEQGERPKSSSPKAANSTPTLAEAASFAARRGRPLVVFTGGFESAALRAALSECVIVAVPSWQGSVSPGVIPLLQQGAWWHERTPQSLIPTGEATPARVRAELAALKAALEPRDYAPVRMAPRGSNC